MVIAPKSGGCIPAIVEEITDEDVELRGYVEELIARFPLETWHLGVDLLRQLRDSGRPAQICTLVNDWYFLRQLPAGRSSELRREFYAQHQTLVPTYQKALDEAGFNGDAILRLSPHPAWVSEYWLRRRAERRLKKLKHPAVKWTERADGVKELILGDLGHECRRLLCGGQADCAEEVLELLCLLHDKGYRNFVNLIPRECECPVNKGCVEAMELFGLRDLSVLNIAMPCLGGGFRDGMALQDVKVHSIRSLDASVAGVDVEHESFTADRWNTSA